MMLARSTLDWSQSNTISCDFLALHCSVMPWWGHPDTCAVCTLCPRWCNLGLGKVAAGKTRSQSCDHCL